MKILIGLQNSSFLTTTVKLNYRGYLIQNSAKRFYKTEFEENETPVAVAGKVIIALVLHLFGRKEQRVFSYQTSLHEFYYLFLTNWGAL